MFLCTICVNKKMAMSVTDGNNISFTSIHRGYSSGIEHEMKEVFRSKKQFDKFWARHTSIYFPRETPPAIDFETHMVACVFRGTKPSGGYGISVIGVKDTGTNVIVQYETRDPPRGAVTTSALTQPFECIQIPISDDTSKRVTFEEKTTMPPPTPYPTFIMSFEEEAFELGVEFGEAKRVVRELNDLDAVNNVKELFNGTMLFVKFDEEKIDKFDAMELLREMVDESSCTIEADPPLP